MIINSKALLLENFSRNFVEGIIPPFHPINTIKGEGDTQDLFSGGDGGREQSEFGMNSLNYLYCRAL